MQEVKIALRDAEFRKKLPKELTEDIQKYLQNPSCTCNIPIYRKVLKLGAKQLKEYYPGREISNPDEELSNLAKNNFSVINCRTDELEKIMKSLPPGRKQITLARYQDQVTVIINELDLIF
jgi:hypothetical protein